MSQNGLQSNTRYHFEKSSQKDLLLTINRLINESFQIRMPVRSFTDGDLDGESPLTTC